MGCMAQPCATLPGHFGSQRQVPPHNGAWHPPSPGDALPPPTQRATPARKSARCGAGAGSPRPHHPRPGNTGNGAWLPAPSNGRPGDGKHLTPDAPHKGERSSPPGRPPTDPAARSPSQGMHAKGTVPGPHPTPAPTARGQLTPTACPRSGQPGEDERLTPNAPHNSARHPPPGTPSSHPHSAQQRLAGAHAMGPVLGPHAHTTGAWETRAVGPGCPPQGRAAGRGKVPDTRRPSQG